MRKIISILFLFIVSAGFAQTLQLKGRIRCSNDINNLSTRGAENVLVVPSMLPKQTVVTGSEPPGFFVIDTKIKKELLYDKNIRLYVVSRCKTCRNISIKKFISSDQITYTNSTPQITIQTKYIKGLCDSIEYVDIMSDLLLRKFHALNNSEYKDLVEKDYWVASPGLLNLLMFATALAPPEPDSIVTDVIPIERLNEAEIQYGKFLLHSTFVNSSNAGFNFAPTRDLSEAAFWNPASVFTYYKKVGFYGSTNWRNQLKLSAFAKFHKRIGVSIGFLESYQREYRVLYNTEIPENEKPSSMFRLNELALFSSVSFKLFESLGIGFTGKLMKQKFDNPQYIERRKEYPGYVVRYITYDVIENKHYHSDYDMDLFLSYGFARHINLGVNFMNVFHSELTANNFLAREKEKKIDQFAIGSGLTFKYGRLNIGVDMLYYNNKIYNLSLGLNVVPFDKAMIQASISTKENVYGIAFQYYRFKIGFINNRNLLLMKSTDSIITIERPYLYSSFVLEI